MKHLLISLVLAVAAYAAWNLADRSERMKAMREITRHGIRLGFVVVVLLLLLYVAAFAPSSSLI